MLLFVGPESGPDRCAEAKVTRRHQTETSERASARKAIIGQCECPSAQANRSALRERRSSALCEHRSRLRSGSHIQITALTRYEILQLPNIVAVANLLNFHYYTKLQKTVYPLNLLKISLLSSWMTSDRIGLLRDTRTVHLYRCYEMPCSSY